MDILEKEARIFANYLVGRGGSAQAIRLYEVALSTSKPDDIDKKLLGFMTRHPHSIGLIDAGLVLSRPDSEARRRLYVLLAILEASTEYHDFFLPKKRSPFYVLFIIYSCIRAVVRAVFGLLLVKVLT